MEFVYPYQHRVIVQDLMDGKFILSRDKHFDQLKLNERYYTDFFEKSFGYELKLNKDYAYLVSGEVNENMSRNISIFFSILCYELDKQGKNFLDKLEYYEFTIEEVDELFENSSYYDLIQSNSAISDNGRRRNFVNGLSRLKIIDKQSDNRFSFTPAYKVFIDYAKTIAYQNLDPSDK